MYVYTKLATNFWKYFRIILFEIWKSLEIKVFHLLHSVETCRMQTRLRCKEQLQNITPSNTTYSWHQGYVFLFFSNATTCPFVDFVVLPPGHGRIVTDFWGWDAHEAQLRCPNDVWVMIEEDVVPGGALNLNSTNLPRPWSPWESSPSRKIPMVEPGIEPGTS